jgi:phosphatidylethanolamine-binding protein (PEBP) family uncharacterized protein
MQGPGPIPGHGPHTYVFQLFALDVELDLPSPVSSTVLVEQMRGHLLGWGRLDGTYEQL